jgi:hypothetical protein
MANKLFVQETLQWPINEKQKLYSHCLCDPDIPRTGKGKSTWHVNTKRYSQS